VEMAKVFSTRRRYSEMLLLLSMQNREIAEGKKLWNETFFSTNNERGLWIKSTRMFIQVFLLCNEKQWKLKDKEFFSSGTINVELNDFIIFH